MTPLRRNTLALEIGDYTWDARFTTDCSRYIITRTLVTSENIHLLRDTSLSLLQVYSTYLSHYNWNGLGLATVPHNTMFQRRMNVLKNPEIII